jgi:AcrR family transcriptional regulator
MSEQDWIHELLKINDEEIKISEKQAKIIKAAIEIFAEKGFASTSTSEIAKKAGVAEGTIFRHYKTKKDLLLSIVTPTLTKVVAPFLAKGFVKEVFNNEYKSYEEFIRELIKNRYQFIKKHLPILKIFFQEIAFHDEFKEQFKKIFIQHVFQKFSQIIQHFQEKGDIIDMPTNSVIRITITTVAGFLLTRFLIFPDHEWDDKTEMERTIQFLMHGLSKDEE